jgi:hypothetical protein
MDDRELDQYLSDEHFALRAAAEEQASRERQAAYEACKKALATYRWWGWSSILSSIRMWLTGVKFRLGMKLWP